MDYIILYVSILMLFSGISHHSPALKPVRQSSPDPAHLSKHDPFFHFWNKCAPVCVGWPLSLGNNLQTLTLCRQRLTFWALDIWFVKLKLHILVRFLHSAVLQPFSIRQTPVQISNWTEQWEWLDDAEWNTDYCFWQCWKPIYLVIYSYESCTFSHPCKSNMSELAI